MFDLKSFYIIRIFLEKADQKKLNQKLILKNDIILNLELEPGTIRNKVEF